MTTASKVGITSLLVLAIGGLAVADAMVREKSLTGQLSLWLGGEESNTSSEGQSASSDGTPIQGIDDAVLAALVEHGFTFEEKNDPSILKQLLPNEPMKQYAILKDGDRAGSLLWVHTSSSTQAFQALKESLLQSFSSDLRDLKDEVIAGPPSYSALTFIDPSLSQERLLFVKAQNGIFEIHVAPGKEEQVQPLVAPLVSKL